MADGSPRRFKRTPRALVGCERSRIIASALEARGWEVISCDLEPARRGGAHYCGDVFDLLGFPFDLGIFHFPCTDSAVSGARWFPAKKLDGRYYASNALWLRGWHEFGRYIPHMGFEHPCSVISTLFRPADQIVQPWMFGHGETKALHWWLHNLPKLTPTNVVEGREQRVWKLGPTKEGAEIDRAEMRSETLPGVAEAVAEQWGEYVIQQLRLAA